jgi:hypothetical protein
MDIGKDVMHHIGKDLHVNVDADIFTRRHLPVKIAKVSASRPVAISASTSAKTAIKSSGDIAVRRGGFRPGPAAATCCSKP